MKIAFLIPKIEYTAKTANPQKGKKTSVFGPKNASRSLDAYVM